MNDITVGQIRHAATFVGGLLVMAGYADAAQVTPEVNTLMGVIGGIMSLAGFVGSIINKFNHRKAVEAAGKGAN